MKLAILAPLAWRTPPEKYGPWEQVASAVAEGMVAAGIDVTLFASGNSLTSGKLAHVIDKPYGDDPSADVKVNECLHISNIMERSAEFDIIHNHYDFLPLAWSRLISTPMVTTIHGFSSPLILPVYRKYNQNTSYVSISDSDRHPSLDYIATVYNGINAADFEFAGNSGSYLLFFGRIHPDKGTLDAIEIATNAKMPLVIAGLIQDHQYWNDKIQPRIDGVNIRYVGNCNPTERNEVLGNAIALLHPVHFDEPFGLSVAESMMCGTPVIAFNRGSMPELIKHGTTGFLVRNISEAVEATEKINGIRRADCRAHAIAKFSRPEMVRQYLEVYEKILSRTV